MSPVNPLSLVGLMLTLASLLGSFFYLQLSQWLRDILALWQKTDLNHAQGEDAEKRAIVECRVDLVRLGTWHTYAVNFIVIAFVIFVLVVSLLMIQSANSDPLYGYVELAIFVFSVVFVILSVGLFGLGHYYLGKVRKVLDPP